MTSLTSLFNVVVLKDIVVCKAPPNYKWTIDEKTNKCIATPILEKTIPTISFDELKNKNVNGLSIQKAFIENEEYEKMSVAETFREITKFSDRDSVLYNSFVNVLPYPKNVKGFKYYDDLKMSIRGTNTQNVLNGISQLAKENELFVKLLLKLKNGEEFYCVSENV